MSEDVCQALERELITVREELVETRKARYEIAKDAANYIRELATIHEYLAEFVEKPEDPAWVLALRAKRKIANLKGQVEYRKLHFTQPIEESKNAERNPQK